jgi:hypothetical protein
MTSHSALIGGVALEAETPKVHSLPPHDIAWHVEDGYERCAWLSRHGRVTVELRRYPEGWSYSVSLANEDGDHNSSGRGFLTRESARYEGMDIATWRSVNGVADGSVTRDFVGHGESK